MICQNLSNNPGQKNNYCRVKLRLFPQTKGGGKCRTVSPHSRGNQHKTYIFVYHLLIFRDQNCCRCPRRRAFFHDTLIEHVLYLIIHFLSEGKWYSVGGFTYRSRVPGINLVFYQIGALEFNAPFPYGRRAYILRKLVPERISPHDLGALACPASIPETKYLLPLC